MSWNSYIDNLIAQTKDGAGNAHVDKACIIGIDGGAKWTTDSHGSAYKVSWVLFELLSVKMCGLVMARFLHVARRLCLDLVW